MKKLICDITLGGSTKQYLTWSKANLSEEKFINNLAKALLFKARTKPITMAKRSAALIGIVYDQLEGESFYLDIVISAIYEAESILNKH